MLVNRIEIHFSSFESVFYLWTCVGWGRAGTSLTNTTEIFWDSRNFMDTQEGAVSRTVYTLTAGGRNRLNLKLCNSKMKPCLNRCFPFMQLLMKVLGHIVWFFHFYHSLFEDFMCSLPSLSWNWSWLFWRFLQNFRSLSIFLAHYS